MKGLLDLPKQFLQRRVNRRSLFRATPKALLAANAIGAALGGAAVLGPAVAKETKSRTQSGIDASSHAHDGSGPVGDVDVQALGFDPIELLRDWDYGEVSQLDSGQTLREYSIVAIDREIEIAPGIYFPAWTYNGRVPGPTMRCVEGDRIKVQFTNAGTHPHTIHFHGIHSASMDGIPGIGRGVINVGESFTYEFDAFPMGCHLYHCHAVPLKRHIHKGLYGAFIVDPDPTKYSGKESEVAKSRNRQYEENKEFDEMVIVMNGFDTNFDGDNEIYAANTVGFHYHKHPIKISRNQKQRIYLINMTEFDPINSFHLHANFFDYYDHGTTLTPTLRTVDTIVQCQAQRGIIEFSYAGFEPGLYMFHAHQSEFAELGWMSFFELA